MVSDVKNMVGQAGRLPPLDIFGNPRAEGSSTRAIGQGRLVVYPAGTPAQIVDARIADIRAALAPKGHARRGKADEDTTESSA